MKSAVLTLDHSGPFCEQEIDAKLQFWISEIVGIKGVDHVTVRRYLIDVGYLTRNKDGSCYQVPADPHICSFDDGIDELDVASVLQGERDRIALRKKEYLERQSKSTATKNEGIS